MAQSGKTRRGSPLKRWLSHKRLVTIEALLVIGACETYLAGLVKESSLANIWKVLFSMALVVGLFGALFLLAQRWTTQGLKRTHGVVQGLPVPTPMLVVHGGVFVVLVFVWAWVESLPIV